MFRKTLEYLSRLIRPSGKPDRREWVAISISFVLAVTLWFLVTMNTQEFTSSFQVPIKIINVPEDVQLEVDYPPTVEVVSQGKGIELLYEHFERPQDTIFIDFPAYRTQEYFIASNHFDVVNYALKNEIRATRVIPDSIPLVFGNRATRKVPLYANFTLNLPLGYRNVLPIEPALDSVIVSGPESELDTVSFWRTVKGPIRVEDKGNLRVKLESRPFFSVSPHSVVVPVAPVAYTERSLQLPIYPANLPPETRLRLQPDSINARVLVPVVEYESVERQNLYFEVDFNDLDPRSPYVIPKAANLPPQIVLQRFFPIRVEYLIIREL